MATRQEEKERLRLERVARAEEHETAKVSAFYTGMEVRVSYAQMGSIVNPSHVGSVTTQNAILLHMECRPAALIDEGAFDVWFVFQTLMDNEVIEVCAMDICKIETVNDRG